ncbi:hypothetical protein [Streptomyces sp. 029-5]
MTTGMLGRTAAEAEADFEAEAVVRTCSSARAASGAPVTAS